MEPNHNVVPTSACEDDVWQFRPGRNSAGFPKIGNPISKVAVTGNLVQEAGTPWMWEIRLFSQSLTLERKMMNHGMHGMH